MQFGTTCCLIIQPPLPPSARDAVTCIGILERQTSPLHHAARMPTQYKSANVMKMQIRPVPTRSERSEFARVEQILKRLLQDDVQKNHDQHRRNRIDNFADAHHNIVRNAADETGNRAVNRSDNHDKQRRHHADDQRNPRSDHYANAEIASQIVRSEWMKVFARNDRRKALMAARNRSSYEYGMNEGPTNGEQEVLQRSPRRRSTRRLVRAQPAHRVLPVGRGVRGI